MNHSPVTSLLGLLIMQAVAPCLSELLSGSCTDPQNLPFLQNDVRLQDAEIFTVTTDGIMTCARKCLNRKWCKSFNFKRSSSECELNHARLGLRGFNKTHLVAEPGYVFSDVTDWLQRLVGPCANHSCDINRYCNPVNDDDYTCVIEVKPTSCAEVKECDSSSTDGEYWIRLVNFDLYRTRIYCHNMNSDTPTEYLTLPNPNYGIYPLVSNLNCGGESGLLYACVSRGGEFWYHKIRVVLENMKVLIDDKTFANFTNYKVDYGTAYDCYTGHIDGILASCGTVGNFTVDLSGTGWAIPAEQQWQAEGWRAAIESVKRNDDGTVIQLKCGGFSGGCEPKGDLLLAPFPKDLSGDPPTDIHCLP